MPLDNYLSIFLFFVDQSAIIMTSIAHEIRTVRYVELDMLDPEAQAFSYPFLCLLSFP